MDKNNNEQKQTQKSDLRNDKSNCNDKTNAADMNDKSNKNNNNDKQNNR